MSMSSECARRDSEFEQDHDIVVESDCSDYESNRSSREESPTGSQNIDYSPLERVQERRMLRSNTIASGDGRVRQVKRCTGRGGQLRTNASLPSRHGGETPRRNSIIVQSEGEHAVDNTSTEMPMQHSEVREALGDITNGNTNVCSRGRPSSVTKYNRRLQKNGNWSNAQLAAALSTHDEGMNMKQAAKKFHIPYTSFREHLYGNRPSRQRGAKGILSHEEEDQLATWMVQMAERGHGLSLIDLKLKVSDITFNRPTPFRNGIPGAGWMRGWQRRHPELSLRTSQALESARAKGLCKENVESFYDNLQTLYDKHHYSPSRIWNCDESGAQARKNGGGVIIARTGARRVHSVVPDQREWLSVLVCVNAEGLAIPLFYIFRGLRFGRNYIERCEPGATMAMQPRAWMTAYLFSVWISHFIECVRKNDIISSKNRHLLILDGHNSHATLEVVQEARNAGVDIITLPSHTSHALQPLDVSVFKPFKQYFREYRNYWTSRNMDMAASKDTLAHWVSLALRKACTVENITSSFAGAGIIPFNRHAIDNQFGPSHAFVPPTEEADDLHQERVNDEERENEDGECDADNEGEDVPLENAPMLNDVEMETNFAQNPLADTEHFFVNTEQSEGVRSDDLIGHELDDAEANSITRFLTLPTVTGRSNPRKKDPILDFTRSIILTSEDYICATRRMREAKVLAVQEKERNRLEKEETRKRKAAEKEEARVAKAVGREEATRMKALRAAERAEVFARRIAQREALQLQKAEHVAIAAAAKAAKAAERAAKATERRQTRYASTTETAHGQQEYGNNIEHSTGSQQQPCTPPPTCVSHGEQQFIQALPSQSNLPLFFAPPSNFPPGAQFPYHHIVTPMPSTPSLHTLQSPLLSPSMLQFSPYTMFQSAMQANLHFQQPGRGEDE